MDYALRQHAKDVIAEREIAIEWLERVLDQPTLTESDSENLEVENHFGRIPEFGNRVLRVVINKGVVPKRVVSVYFDRRMKDRL